MKLTTTALGIVAALTAVPAAAQLTRSSSTDQKETPAPADTKAGGLKPSAGAAKPLAELQTAVKANDTANIPAKLAAAQTAATTKEDKYLVAIFQRQIALGAHDVASLSTAVEALVGSGIPDATTQSALLMDLGIQQFNAKQFAPAAASFQRATAITPNDMGAVDLLAQAKSAAGQNAEAATLFQKSIQARVAAGQKPPEETYRRAVQAAYDAKVPVAVDLGREWVAAYPSPDSWRNAVAIYRNTTKPDVDGTLDLLRLLSTTGALSSQADYSLYATAAADKTNYPEAQAVIDAGVKAGKVDPASPLFRDIVAGLKAKQKLTEADLVTAEKTAKTGVAMVRIGDFYYGMGNYAKAAELYRSGIAKGGADANVANLHLGMALARSGDLAGAKTALSAVSGPRTDIAKYWLLYLQTKG